jgi:hypothetical protein
MCILFYFGVFNNSVFLKTKAKTRYILLHQFIKNFE